MHADELYSASLVQAEERVRELEYRYRAKSMEFDAVMKYVSKSNAFHSLTLSLTYSLTQSLTQYALLVTFQLFS